ncbi:aspartyl/asparaginyl beta-hydroxylase domain-containing protein [Desertivirga xinjiangensis]|uniref:aspartyl/asparaginyl beta-hydroxylase domain-containing protein n=1 Tax=Desertivirga xinjiangensis TaxID=539206 RepID=UPI00210B0F0D|nr:aspartyl/asparaginyl beta-hydroxylase domain-containing protein [Pedobacter xinjiangensis]
MSKLWFSVTAKDAYAGNEESFAEVEGESWAQSLLANYEPIKKEFSDYLAAHGMVPYFHQSMVNKKDTWKTLGLKFWNIIVYKHRSSFPFTYKWLSQNPEVIALSYSKLEPFSRILPHVGDTNGIYRVHLGVDIPEGLPRCGFRVKDVKRPWEEKKFLAFLDAFEHEAWNETEKSRVIMMIDVIRPEFRKKQSYICKQVIASLALQKLAAMLLIHNHKPEAKPVAVPLWFRRMMAYAMLAALSVILPVRNIVARMIAK